MAADLDCGAPINDGPLHIVAKAGLRGLDTWVRTATPPPQAARLDVIEGEKPEVSRDEDGIALGGIRTPPVDVPTAVLSGKPGPNPDVICILMGSTTPLPDARVAQLYGSRAAYEEQYAASTDLAVQSGFVLEEDRAAMLDYARPDAVGA